MGELFAALAFAAAITWEYSYIGARMTAAASARVTSARLDNASRVLTRVHQETWLFAPPGFVSAAVISWRGDMGWTVVFYALLLLWWWSARNWPDENRWKKRGRKAREAVARRGARLVVVPATGGA